MTDGFVNNMGIAFAPDPVAMMPKIDISKFKSLDDLINGILDDLGNGIAAAVSKAPGAVLDTMNAAGNAVKTTVGSIGNNITALGSFAGSNGATIAPRSIGLAQGAALPSPGNEMLGNLQPLATPGCGLSLYTVHGR